MNFLLFKKKEYLIILMSLFFFVILYIFLSHIDQAYRIAISIAFSLLLTNLLLLAYEDLNYKSISNLYSLIPLIALLIVNSVLLLINGQDFSYQLWQNYTFTPFSNMSAALLLGSLFLITVVLTKERGMGIGDVRIIIITGLLLGIRYSLYAVSIGMILGTVYGLYYLHKGNSKEKIKIPLVSFIVVGIIAALFLSALI